MSRLFGYLANDPALLRCALDSASPLLRASDAPDGWGIGYYQGGEVLLQRHPKPHPEGVDFYTRLKDLRTDIVVGHVRTATVGNQKNENTHPYRFRSWMLAHNGTLARFQDIEKRMLETIPEFLLRNIRGQTDSETMFHLFLAFLHDNGKLDDQTITARQAAQALRQTVAFLDRLLGEPSDINVVATNGRIMLASRRVRTMLVQRQHGILNCKVHRDPNPDYSKPARAVAHDHLKSVLIVSDPPELAERPEGFEPVPDDHMVLVSRDLSVEIIPLRGDPL